MEVKMKLALICTYFGNLPSHMFIWLETCKYNPNVNFLLITDDHTKFELPRNVKIIYWTFDMLEKRIKTKFDFPICIKESPFKICDFRPLYGYIFSDYLEAYDFFGQCELDMLFGNIKKFITDETMSKYKKLLYLGHLTIYKNDNSLLNSLQIPFKSGKTYYDLLQKSYLCNLDEQFHENSINTLFQENNIPIYAGANDYIADIMPGYYEFRLCRYYANLKIQIEKPMKQIFIWNKGTLIRSYLKNAKCFNQEFLYMHIQKRNMEIKIDENKLLKDEKFAIVPNEFIPFDFDVNIHSIRKLSKTKLIYPKYFELKKKNLKGKIEIFKRKFKNEY